MRAWRTSWSAWPSSAAGDRPGRPRHQGRPHRRAARARAPGRRRAQFRGRARVSVPHPARGKNRFGPPTRSACSRCPMRPADVANPSALFLSERRGHGSAPGVRRHRGHAPGADRVPGPGRRPPPTPRRAVPWRWDTNRLAMVLAVLEARCGAAIGDRDVYLNVAGGLRITEPAADLAVAAALVPRFPTKLFHGWWCSARSVWGATPVRSAGGRRVSGKRPSWAFAGALVPRGRPGTGPAPRTEGIAIDEIEHLSDLVARFQPADRPMKPSAATAPGSRPTRSERRI